MSDSTFSTSGLLRYRVWILVQLPDGESDISFDAYGPVLPRIDEGLDFNGNFGEELSVCVTGVDHDWFLPGDDDDHPGVTVACKVTSSSEGLLQRLLDEPGALDAWLSKLPRLAPIKRPV